MSFTDQKIKESERNSLNVKSVPEARLTGTVRENKNVFDRLVECVAERHNELIDALAESVAAAKIGADLPDVLEKNVQGILNKLDTDIKNRYTKAEAEALLGDGTSDLVQSIDVALDTGIITVTKKDGTIQTWDTQLEKIPAKFELTEEAGTYYLQITNEDGTSTRTDVTDLTTHYGFDNSDELSFMVTGDGTEKRVTASIRANSIGIEKLSLSIIARFEDYVSEAAQFASAAASSAAAAKQSGATADQALQEALTAKDEAQEARTEARAARNVALTASDKAQESTAAAVISERAARSFAKGGTNSREGEETDNAKYYSELSGKEASRAKAEADRASEIAGGDFATASQVNYAVSEHNEAAEAHASQFAGKADDDFTHIPLAVCNTAADIQIKEIEIPNWTAEANPIFAVKFLNANTASGVKISINGGAAVPVRLGAVGGLPLTPERYGIGVNHTVLLTWMQSGAAPSVVITNVPAMATSTAAGVVMLTDIYTKGLPWSALSTNAGRILDSKIRVSLRPYSATESYAANVLVMYEGTIYKSLQSSNLNNPVGDSAWWEKQTRSVYVGEGTLPENAADGDICILL